VLLAHRSQMHVFRFPMAIVTKGHFHRFIFSLKLCKKKRTTKTNDTYIDFPKGFFVTSSNTSIFLLWLILLIDVLLELKPKQRPLLFSGTIHFHVSIIIFLEKY